jgi:Transglycosylase SLT domain
MVDSPWLIAFGDQPGRIDFRVALRLRTLPIKVRSVKGAFRVSAASWARSAPTEMTASKTPPLQAPKAPAPQPSVERAIRKAAERTGVDFQYMLRKAEQESGFQPNAKAPDSNAAGLYQFQEQTWLQMVREHGAKYGLAPYAKSIEPRAGGGFQIADKRIAQAVLSLRSNPQIAAYMAGEYANANRHFLSERLGRDIGSTDLYFAHFLGPSGALKLLRQLSADGTRPAADLLPRAASSNASAFHDGQGKPLTVAAFYDRYEKRIAGDRPPAAIAQAPRAAKLAGASEAAVDARVALAKGIADGRSDDAIARALAAIEVGPALHGKSLRGRV